MSTMRARAAARDRAAHRWRRRRCATRCAERLFPPTLVLDPPDDADVMRHEIFGPILPVQSTAPRRRARLHQLARSAAGAVSVLATTARRSRRILGTRWPAASPSTTRWCISASHVCRSAASGPSGMGAIHGPAGFDTFSKLLPVFRQSRWAASDLLKPPYSGKIDALVRWLAKSMRDDSSCARAKAVAAASSNGRGRPALRSRCGYAGRRRCPDAQRRPIARCMPASSTSRCVTIRTPAVTDRQPDARGSMCARSASWRAGTSMNTMLVCCATTVTSGQSAQAPRRARRRGGGRRPGVRRDGRARAVPPPRACRPGACRRRRPCASGAPARSARACRAAPNRPARPGPSTGTPTRCRNAARSRAPARPARPRH